MAFINENISEEDKVKYKIENLSDYKYRHWSSWTIDRDRDCFLLYNGMSHDLPFQYFFILYYLGKSTKITVDVKGNGQSPERVNLTNYEVRYVELPDAIKDKKDEIVQIFSEAVKKRENKPGVYEVAVLYSDKKLQVN